MATQLIVNQRLNLQPNQVTDNKEVIQLIWLDGNINNSSDCVLTKTMLIQLNPAVQFYTDFNRCLDLIKLIKNEQIFLIVSGSFVRPLLSHVHNHPPLVAVFIFCAHPQHHEALINDYDKIIGVYTDQKTLLASIREKTSLIEKQSLAFNLFDQKQKSMKDLSKESASFLWHQMLIYVLKQISQDQQSKQQMIELCQDYYQNDKKELDKIETFRKSYKDEQAIQWYTDDGFLYKLLNKALRTEDVELLYTFRFFIIDLCAAIQNEGKHLKGKEKLTLYRGTQIPSEELEKIKANVGQIISTNGFLSTSRNLNVSIEFARSKRLNKSFQAVLFQIHADPSTKSISFADIENKTLIKGEEEVLFNLNSLFKIHSISFDKTLKLWKIQLNTTDEGSDQVEEYLKMAKQDLEQCSPMIYFGGLLMKELGQIARAEKYFQMLLKSLPSNHPDIASIYNNIGNVYREKGELKLALKNYEIGYELRRKQFSSDHPHIAGSLNNIGEIHRRKGNYDLALDYYQKALKIKEKTSSGDSLHKGIIIENIGLVYGDKNEFDTALIYLFRALEMFKHVLPDQHDQIALCFGKIGNIHEKKGDYNTALKYYQEQLKMEEQCLAFDHPHLSSTLRSIVDIYTKMDEIDKGLKFCREKLDDQKTQLGENHSCIARTLMIMGDVTMSNDLKKSLQYYEAALSITENCRPPDRQTAAECHQAMASIYGNLNMLDNALRCFFKALDLRRQTLSSDHLKIAEILMLMGCIYENMRNLSEALRYHNESLSIYRDNYGLEHEDVKKIEKKIARLNKLWQKDQE